MEVCCFANTWFKGIPKTRLSLFPVLTMLNSAMVALPTHLWSVVIVVKLFPLDMHHLEIASLSGSRLIDLSMEQDSGSNMRQVQMKEINAIP